MNNATPLVIIPEEIYSYINEIISTVNLDIDSLIYLENLKIKSKIKKNHLIPRSYYKNWSYPRDGSYFVDVYDCDKDQTLAITYKDLGYQSHILLDEIEKHFGTLHEQEEGGRLFYSYEQIHSLNELFKTFDRHQISSFGHILFCSKTELKEFFYMDDKNNEKRKPLVAKSEKIKQEFLQQVPIYISSLTNRSKLMFELKVKGAEHVIKHILDAIKNQGLYSQARNDIIIHILSILVYRNLIKHHLSEVRKLSLKDKPSVLKYVISTLILKYIAHNNVNLDKLFNIIYEKTINIIGFDKDSYLKALIFSAYLIDRIHSDQAVLSEYSYVLINCKHINFNTSIHAVSSFNIQPSSNYHINILPYNKHSLILYGTTDTISNLIAQYTNENNTLNFSQLMVDTKKQYDLYTTSTTRHLILATNK